MTIAELHAKAEEEMKANTPTGRAWLYVYEITTDQSKSRVWVTTMLNRAINDPDVFLVRKWVYEEARNLLDEHSIAANE